MSYSALVDSNLNKAFNLVKDLAVDVILVKKTKSEFNFSTGEAEASSTSITTKAIFIEEKKTSKDVNSSVKQVMLKTKSVGDLTLFDTLQAGAVIWKFTNILKSDGYITIAEVSREL